MTPAEPVPPDLYVVMDSSLSMNELTTAGPSKWAAVKTAMGNFFKTTSGLGVGLKYFPGVQSGAMTTCTMDGADPTACGAYGPCDRRKTCVGNNASTSQVLPLCGVTGATTTCSATSESCALVQDCGSMTYCAKGASATAGCSGCNTFLGYCHLRDRCDAAYYATPGRRRRDARRHDGRPGGHAQFVPGRPSTRRLHADWTGADGRSDVRARAHREHADAPGGDRAGDRRLAWWIPHRHRHPPSAHRATSPASRPC